jgi:hypothetical protein
MHRATPSVVRTEHSGGVARALWRGEKAVVEIVNEDKTKQNRDSCCIIVFIDLWGVVVWYIMIIIYS